LSVSGRANFELKEGESDRPRPCMLEVIDQNPFALQLASVFFAQPYESRFSHLSCCNPQSTGLG
jgi:hypothetical protein